MAKRSSKTPIDEIAEDAIRRIREAAETEKKMHAIEQQTKQTSPRPATGAGRPPKGEAPRLRHSIGFEPKLKDWLEQQRLDGESFADTVNRLLTQKMNGEKN